MSPRDLPGFDDSAMDGFAVQTTDGATRLRIVGEVAAGARQIPTLQAGTALRIMTGAPMPLGSDAVVIREDATDNGDTVEVPLSQPGAHIRRRGEDLAIGALALAAGTVLGPGELGLLAALGITRPLVARRPRVALLATGDELVDVATVPQRGQRVDSSAHALLAQLREAGAEPTYLGCVRDDLAETTERIRAALTYDVVLTTGGVSVGDHDHVKAALAAAGAELTMWKVAMRPGKPLAVARAGNVLCFGLPGNPVSSMISFELFVRPTLLAMQQRREVFRPRAMVELSGGYQKSAGRSHFVRVQLTRHETSLLATPLRNQGSHMLTSMIGVDALVEIGADVTHLPPGALVPALLLEPR